MSARTLGSLFTGYGGLDMAVAAATGARTIWHSDIDPGACRILAHHWPDVPNLGDITAIDWSRVSRPRIVTGGFPCTDISGAGEQAGLIRYGDGKTRSGLWAEMCKAIDTLRPELVVAENVRALTSVKADCNLEPCPGCVGNEPGEHVLRALGAVLGDLADIGYDARWTGLRAADVGAAHGRFRIFIAATDARGGGFNRRPDRPSESESARIGGGQPADSAASASADAGCLSRWEQGSAGTGRASGCGACGEPAGRGGLRAATDSDRAGLERRESAQRCDLPARRAATDSEGDGWREGRPESARIVRGSDAAVRCDAAADAERRGCDGRAREQIGRAFLGAATAGPGCEPWCQRDASWRAPNGDDYGPAVRRWHDLTRCVPPPTGLSPRSGKPQLSPFFDEWLMGVPLGHMTDPAIWAGMKPSAARNAVLKAAGNGVVPQQALAALCDLLAGTGWLVGGR